ncbi:MAG: hypothetical protein K0S53_1475 [Bacteroidetes bacterium]|jgi:hypothetical protein|nr:hypothetical protein [Bacteroidota bacterium]
MAFVLDFFVTFFIKEKSKIKKLLDTPDSYRDRKSIKEIKICIFKFMLDHVKHITNRFVFPVLTGTLILYVIARGCMVDITDDEAWSFFNVKNFWYVETLCTGNTHWFNFAAIKAAILLGCERTWQIRWFSMLSGIGFIYVVYVWLRTIKVFYLKCFAFCFLLLNPYLIEYLSLARGYTTALFFLALSLLFLMRAQNAKERRYLFLALLFAGLSAVANFNFLYFFAAFCLVYFYECYFKNGLGFLKQKQFYTDFVFSICTLAIVLVAFRFIVICSNDIAAHGGRELVPAIFSSFIDTLLYRNFSLSQNVVIVSAYVLLVLILFAIGFGMLKYNTHQNRLYLYASWILALMLLFCVINKWCFNVLYPNDRTTLMFYPLIAIVLVGLLHHIFTYFLFERILICLLAGFLFFNFIKSINVDTGYDHPYCKDTERYFKDLKKLNAKNIGMSVEFYCVFYKYYQVTDPVLKGESINTLGVYSRWIKESPLTDFDYIVLLPGSTLSWYRNSSVKLELVHFYPDTKVSVFRVVK